MWILGLYFPVLAFCVGVRNCPSRSRWGANKQPPVLDRGKHRLRGSHPTSHKCAIFSEFNICPTKISSITWILLGPIEYVCPTCIQWLDGSCVKGRVSHWLRCCCSSFGDCSSNLKASQGYFQLMIHTCHLDAEAALSIIANQRWNLAMHRRERVLNWNKRKWLKMPTLQVPTFPAVIRSRWRRGGAAGLLIGTADGRLCAPLHLLSTRPSFSSFFLSLLFL